MTTPLRFPDWLAQQNIADLDQTIVAAIKRSLDPADSTVRLIRSPRDIERIVKPTGKTHLVLRHLINLHLKYWNGCLRQQRNAEHKAWRASQRAERA